MCEKKNLFVILLFGSFASTFLAEGILIYIFNNKNIFYRCHGAHLTFVHINADALKPIRHCEWEL